MKQLPKIPICIDKAFKGNDPNLEMIKAHLMEKCAFSECSLTKKLLKEFISKAKGHFKKESNTLKIDGDVVIIGDIHGQFLDMMGIFA